MTWVGFPIDVVVIHGPNHVTIHERCIDGICLEAGNKCSGLATTAAHGAMMLEQDLRVFLLAATEPASDGIEPEQFRCLDRLWRKVFVFQSASPLSDRVRQQTF